MPLLLILLFLMLLPLLLMDVIFIALSKLSIDPIFAPGIIFLMFVGSLINIPIWREVVTTPFIHHPLNIWGLGHYLPKLQRPFAERIVAINVGGFVIPILLVTYEIVQIARQSPALLLALAAAVLINILVCFRLAKPIAQVGIVLPAFIPGLVAATSALLLAPNMAPPIAFCAGVLGPVVGADFMHLNKIRQTQIGLASIGGAGTIDGIIISGLVAVILS